MLCDNFRTLKIRPATTEEAAALTTIAIEAKRYWGYPEHWIQHWQADLTISPEFIDNNHVYVAEDTNDLLGFYALSIHNNKAELEHMWVAPHHIGTGVGKELFLNAMERASELRLTAVEISSDPNAEGFYRRQGAERIGETVTDLDGKPRVVPRLRVEPKS